MKKLDGRTKAGRAAKLAAFLNAIGGQLTENHKRLSAKSANVEAILAERGTRYGEFAGHASITQNLKSVMRATENWDDIAHDQTEALEMIAHKIGRILNGDPNYADSWVDIAGYAKLVADRLEKEAGK